MSLQFGLMLTKLRELKAGVPLTKRMLFFLAVFILTQSCKKDEKDPEPEPAPVVVVNDISLKQNGTEVKCSGCGFSYRSGFIRGLSFNLPSVKEPVLLNFGFGPYPGEYNLISESDEGSVSFSIKRDGVFYSSAVGTIRVSEVDTSQSGMIERMKATFSFFTDTVNGKSFVILDGVINFVN